MIHNPERPKRRLIAGVLLCAALSACSVQSGPPAAPENEQMDAAGKTIVATVSGAPIYMREVTDAARITGQLGEGEVLTQGDQVFTQILPEVIDQRLLAESAKAAGLHKTDRAKYRLAMAQERILANMALQGRIESRVTPQATRALYDSQIKLRQAGQEARASHILVETEAQADAVVKRLESGEDFAALATEVSLDRGTQITGGDLGYFQADDMVPEFSKAVFGLETGEVSPPFESQFGWHIAKLTDKRAAPVPSFEDMEGEITNFVTMDEISKLIAELREDADIVIKDPPAPAASDEVVTDSDAVESDNSNE